MTDVRYDLEITSVQNETVKRLAALKDRKERMSQQKILLEGPHLIEEALRADKKLDMLLVSERGERIVDWPKIRTRFAKQLGTIVKVSDHVLEKISDAKTPQGICAEMSLPQMASDDLWATLDSVIALDGLNDPGNLGTIIRSAVAMGVQGIWLGDGCVDVFHPKTIRATQGAIFHVPFMQASIDKGIQIAKASGADVFVLVPRGGIPLDETNAKSACWWVVGNEAHGVQNDWKKGQLQLVSIPMDTRTESLNAAMAATIACYEMARQRRSE